MAISQVFYSRWAYNFIWRKKMITLELIKIKLAEAIKNSGLTQMELAQKLNIRQSNISHYVKGDKMPALDTLANLCVVLDLDANEILCVK